MTERERVTTEPQSEPQMPEDWDDREGWNKYYSATIPAGGDSGLQRADGLRFFSFVAKLGERVWFPGCGLDVTPALYSHLGMKVLATDFAESAVEIQRGLARKKPEELWGQWAGFLEESKVTPREGAFEARTHDFRAGLGENGLDAIINRRAFQGLSSESMRAAARVAFEALRPGGRAIFDTMNVQGARRTMLEEALSEAGFFVPYQEIERWYREKMDATGITYSMILGRPFVPGWAKYPRAGDPTATHESDQQLLRSFEQEYQQRLEKERPEVVKRETDPRTIAAYVVYSTG